MCNHFLFVILYNRNLLYHLKFCYFDHFLSYGYIIAQFVFQWWIVCHLLSVLTSPFFGAAACILCPTAIEYAKYHRNPGAFAPGLVLLFFDLAQ